MPAPREMPAYLWESFALHLISWLIWGGSLRFISGRRWQALGAWFSSGWLDEASLLADLAPRTFFRETCKGEAPLPGGGLGQVSALS